MIYDYPNNDRELLTCEEFLKLTAEEKLSIKESRIIPPKLGTNNWGGIEVTWKYPKFKSIFD